MSPATICALWVVAVAVSCVESSAVGDPSITVEFSVVNDLIGAPFKHSIQVSVTEGSVLLDVMKEAQKMNPNFFSFQTETTSWGPFVTTINHLSGTTNGKTYWQFFSGKSALGKGVGSYVPKDGEHIIATFSKY
ncbi:cobalamin binding intrinsic factor-like [Lissotriton helveticus]